MSVLGEEGSVVLGCVGWITGDRFMFMLCRWVRSTRCGFEVGRG